MKRQYRKLAFSLIALLAVTVSLFKTNMEGAVFTSAPYKSHPDKTVFSCLHTSSALLLLEIDSEESVDEESDDEVREPAFEFDLFTHITFAALGRATVIQTLGWEAAFVKGQSVPIYLLNRNFRL